MLCLSRTTRDFYLRSFKTHSKLGNGVCDAENRGSTFPFSDEPQCYMMVVDSFHISIQRFVLTHKTIAMARALGMLW